MKIKKHAGICMAVVLAAGTVAGGASIASAKSEQSEKSIELGADESKKEEAFSFGSITDMENEDEVGEKMEEAADDAEDTREDTTDDREIETIETAGDYGAGLPNVKQVVKDVMPAIVSITKQSVETVSFFGRQYKQDIEGSGSGIIVAQSDTELLIATNNHVVDNADDLTVCFSVDVDDEKNEDDKIVKAQVKGTNSANDIAVIAVKLDDITDEIAGKIGIVEMGDSSAIEVGDWVVAIGNALGVGQSVTFGIVSALDRDITLNTDNGYITNTMIQTDAAINFGNSGGALLDMDGRLIGINSAKTTAEHAESMGYAIPIDTAKPIIEDLMSQATRTKVDADKAGALGVIPVDVSEEARQIYNIPVGAFVYELTENSAAADAGVKQGDIITKLDQSVISSKEELLNRMKYYEAGEEVAVTVKRAGDNGYEEKVFDVTLGKRSDLPEEYQTEEETEETEDETDEYDNGYDDRYYGGYGNDFYGGWDDFFRYFGY